MGCGRQIGPFECCSVVCGDCLELMKSLPDGCVDAVITDPPYGMRYHKDNLRNLVHGDDRFPDEALSECFRLADCFTLAFCRWNNLSDLPKPKSFVACVKNSFTMGDLSHEYGRQWEGVAFYPKSKHRFVYRPGDVVPFKRELDAVHPTQKPVSLLVEIIGQHEADSILDPFTGSGTTLVAAKKLGRHFLGFEISPEYCRIAEERLARIDAQPSLFEPKPEQLKLGEDNA